MTEIERKSKFVRRLAVLGLVVLAGLLTGFAFRLDAPVRRAVVEWQGKTWKASPAAKLQGAVSRYGDWPFLMLAGAAGWLLARRMGRPDWQRILVTAMVASTIAGMLANTMRSTTGRTRPRESPKIEQGWYGPYHDGRWTVGNSKFNSFPSGHTATAVGFAGVLLFARPFVGSIAMLLALGIALSRILLGAHHPSDVTVAALLALGVAWAAWRVALRRGDEIVAWVRAKIRRQP